MADLYSVLEISKDATVEQIEKAYRKLAMQWHPDRNPGDAEAEAKFKEINNAHEVLSDPVKRSNYDRCGDPGGRRSTNFSHNPFESFFEQHFGGSVERGNNVQTRVNITLEEAAKGCVKSVNFKKRDRCKKCAGQGGTKFYSCKSCGGLGYQQVRGSPFMINMQCKSCEGSGKAIQDKCGDCLGYGMTPGKDHEVEIRIPAGIANGMQVRVSGAGEVGKFGTAPGDLFVVIFVENHQFYVLDEGDLTITAWLPYYQLVNGTKLTVPTILGEKIEINIPAGTNSGTKFSINGKGMPLVGHRRSNFVVNVRAETPKDFSEEYKKVLDSLKEFEDSNITPERKIFNDKLLEQLSK